MPVATQRRPARPAGSVALLDSGPIGSAASGSEYAVEVRASGDFTLSCTLLESVGASLATPVEMAGPILSANLASGTVDLRVAVRAPSRAAARSLAACALHDAMAAAGAGEVRMTPGGWRHAIAARARRS
jgi:hypothetical protein